MKALTHRLYDNSARRIDAAMLALRTLAWGSRTPYVYQYDETDKIKGELWYDTFDDLVAAQQDEVPPAHYEKLAKLLGRNPLG